MIVALSRLATHPRALAAIAPKALGSGWAARKVNTKMAASDDERWPDTEVYTFGREEIDHLQQLRELKEKHLHYGDEHSYPLTLAEEEIKLQAKVQEKIKAQHKKEDEIRHHMWE